MRPIRRALAALVLPVALLSAVPNVQACPYAWSDLTLECVLEIPPAALAAGCKSVESGCAVAQAPECGESCPLAREAAATSAMDANHCPRKASPGPPCERPASVRMPEAAADVASTPCPASPSGSCGRAWCVGPASGGPGVPADGLSIHPEVAATIPAFAPFNPIPTSERLGAPSHLARGPTRDSSRRPPIRAPPCDPLSS